MSEWPMVKLGDVANFVRGLTFKPSSVIPTEKGLIVLRTKNIQEKLDLTDLIAIPQDFLKREDQLVQSLDTLVSVANSWNLVGKCCIAPLNPTNLAIGGFIAALRSLNADKLDPQYLYHWFNSTAIQNTVRSFSNKTTNISNLQIKRCLDLMIPLPPLGEQKRIAEILSEVNKIIICTNSQRETVDQLERRLFQEFRNQNSKSSQRVGDKCQVHTGATPSRNNPAYYNGSIPWIKTGEVQGTIIDNAEEYITETAIQETNCRKFPAGTILVAMYGQGATRGRAGILNCGAATNQACAAIIPHLPEDKDYTFAVLHNSYNKLRSLGRGGTQPNLNLTLIKNFEIPWPTKSTRENFMQRWRQLNILRLLLTQRSALLQELQRSLSARAFAGLL
ncbi:restriction endonuclease subunit S [Corynebacterium durum]|uniref:restriction endonuclease subunit S n=1 Tax=Corynebacterium durum TaxID=61592 RepID=UPI0028E479D7|nr:restriction endonuclease subunit S [Corynebacterium durum]